MTIRHLRIFIEVAENGKMSLAAKKLFISQPTVSQAIKELEEHYGVLLFERLKKRLYITDVGKKLLSYAKNVVNQFDNLEEKMFDINKKEKIRIGATMTVGECILSSIIYKLRKKDKQVGIYSYMNNTQIIEQKLLNSDVDIGIVEGEVKSQDLISIPEVKDCLVLICSTEHPFTERKTIKLEELAYEKFAMREKGSGTRELFEKYMLEKRVPINIVFEGNSPEAIKREVMNNNCLAVISAYLVDDEVKNSKIHIIKHSKGAWDRYFSIVYHKDKILTEGMKNLIDVTKCCKNMPDLMEFESGRLIE